MEDKAYNQEQKNLAIKKRQEELKRKKILEEMRAEARERKVREKEEAREEEELTAVHSFDFTKFITILRHGQHIKITKEN